MPDVPVYQQAMLAEVETAIQRQTLEIARLEAEIKRIEARLKKPGSSFTATFSRAQLTAEKQAKTAQLQAARAVLTAKQKERETILAEKPQDTQREAQRITRRMIEIYQTLADLRKQQTTNPTAFLMDKKNPMPQMLRLENELEALQTSTTRLLERLERGWLPTEYFQIYAILYTEPEYQGRRWLLIDPLNLPDGLEVRSIQVSSGASLYAQRGHTGGVQDIYADIPETHYTRLGKELRSIKLWDATNRPYTGGWVIQTMKGAYLSARRADDIRVETRVKNNEVFILEVQGSLSDEQRQVSIFRADPEVRIEKSRTPINLGGLTRFTMVNETGLGYRKFSLTNGTQWVALDPKTNRFTLTDQAADREIFTLAVKVAAHEGQIGELLTGEIALYEHYAYWGKAWVFYMDAQDFLNYDGLNDVISSIRLGPNTGVTVYRNVNYKEDKTTTPTLHPFGLEMMPKPVRDVWETASQESAKRFSKEDIYQHTPDLSKTQVGNDQLSALRAWGTVEALPYTCTLSEDYDSRMRKFSAYRTTLRLPKEVTKIWVWTTDAATITVGGKRYQTNEDVAAELEPDITGSLVITQSADGLQVPGLKVRTNVMRDSARFLIFPEQAAQKRIQDLSPNALWEATDNSKRPLVDRQKFSQSAINNVQQALQVTTRTVRYETTPVIGGKQTERYISTEGFDQRAWMLDFGTANQLRPAGSASALKSGQANRVQAAAQPTADIEFKWVSDAQMEAVRQKLSGSLKQGIFDTIGDAFEEAGDTINEVIVEPIVEGGKEVLNVIVSGVETAINFVVDTAVKVYEFVAEIIEYIGVAIQKFIEWLQFFFAWEDILHTQDLLLELVDKSFKQLKTWAREAKEPVGDMFDTLSDAIMPIMDQLIEQYGGRQPLSTEETETPNFLEEAMEKITWLFSKLSDALDGGDRSDSKLTLKLTTTIEDFWVILQDQIKSMYGMVEEMGNSLMFMIDELSANPSNITVILGTLISVSRTLIEAALTMLKGIVVGVLEILADIIDLVDTLLATDWDIPFLGDLFKLVAGGKRLSAINLVTLILAIPTTLIAKAIFPNRNVLKSVSSLAQDQKRDVNLALGVINITSGVIGSYTNSMLDILPDAVSEKLPPKVIGFLELLVTGCDIVGVVTDWTGGYKAFENGWEDFEYNDKGELTGDGWERVVWLYDVGVLGLDLLSIVVSAALTKGAHLSNGKRLNILSADWFGESMGTVIGLGMLAVRSTYIHLRDDSDAVEDAESVIGAIPMVFSFCHIEKFAAKTKYISMAVLAATSQIHAYYLLGAANHLATNAANSD